MTILRLAVHGVVPELGQLARDALRSRPGRPRGISLPQWEHPTQAHHLPFRPRNSPNPTKEHACRDTARYIELRYNNKQLQFSLGCRTPNHGEHAWQQQLEAA